MFSASTEDFQSHQVALHLDEFGVTLNPLEYFAQNEVGQPETLRSELAVKPSRVFRDSTPEVVDPNGRIDDHHGGA
jgi:hypothetical protein